MSNYEIRAVEHYEVRFRGQSLAEFKSREKAAELIGMLEKQDAFFSGDCCKGVIDAATKKILAA